MRNNLAKKTSREETSTTNDRDDVARTLELGLGQHTMAKNEDEREGGKNRPEVAQVMVVGSPAAAGTAAKGRRRQEQRRGAARLERSSTAGLGQSSAAVRAAQRGGAVQPGTLEEEGAGVNSGDLGWQRIDEMERLGLRRSD
jgi:hypothetical protein